MEMKLFQHDYQLYSIEKNGIWIKEVNERYSLKGELKFVPLWYDIKNISCERRMKEKRAKNARREGTYGEFLKILGDEFEHLQNNDIDMINDDTHLDNIKKLYNTKVKI